MKKLFLIAFAFGCTGAFGQSLPGNDSTIILSEVMFAAQSGDNEFIEIYNTSPSDQVDLNNFQIKYYNSSADNISSAGAGTILAPLSFAVIFEGDYDLNNGIYKDLVPGGVLILKISDNAFGSSGMSNSSDRTVQLFNSSGELLEVHAYSADNSKGISDEKILLNNDTSTSNWDNSLRDLGTPGFRNSVSPINFDPGIVAFTSGKNFEITGNEILLNLVIKNFGINASQPYQVNIFRDMNNDSTGQAGELLTTYNGSALTAGDSVIYQFSTSDLTEGNNLFIASLQSAKDENLLNNLFLVKIKGVKVNELRNDLVINEVMYAPESPAPEWIEIFNRSNKEINLSGYNISDNTDTLKVYAASQVLKPKEYFVFSSDSSITDFYNLSFPFSGGSMPTLNNSGDKIILLDSLYRVIDSLEYSPNWGGNDGKSLERISADNSSTDPGNWQSSSDFLKATPGKLNSVTQKDYDISAAKILFTPPGPLVGDNVSISALIKNAGKYAANFSINLYEDNNGDSTDYKLLDKLTHQYLAEADSAVFNFTYSINGILKSHDLIVQIESEPDEDSTNNKISGSISPGYPPQSLEINEIMYDPAEDEPEWIELFNNSVYQINLKNWRIINLIPSLQDYTLSTVDHILDPGKYLVLAADSSFFLKHAGSNSNALLLNFGSLNNNFDGTAIRDLNNNLIDSVVYSSDWGGGNGVSLERISNSKDSNDRLNWASSKINAGSTPGGINSVSRKDYDIAATKIIYDPSSPLSGDDVNISALVKNPGRNNAGFSISLYEKNNESISGILRDSLFYYNLPPEDSVIIPFSYSIKDINEEHDFFVKVGMDADQDTTNNNFYKSIKPGYSPNSVVINEIMYDPAEGEPEWIELYNNSDKQINLMNWKIINLLPSPSSSSLTMNDLIIDSAGYVIIASDSSFHNSHNSFAGQLVISDFGSLNNSADGIAIRDLNNNLIDSVVYSSDWGGGNGFSLERISTSISTNTSINWRTSQNNSGSTPGGVNSVSRKDFDIAVTKILFDPSSPLSGDEVNISTMIRNPGKNKADFTLTLLEDTDKDSLPNILLDSVSYKNLPSADSVNIVFNYSIKGISGRHDFIVKAKMDSDQDTTNNSGYNIIAPGYRYNSIVINEIMYDPAGDEPEWIELINNSTEQINLKSWNVINMLPSPYALVLTENEFLIDPAAYLIIARDSSFYNSHPSFKGRVLIFDFGSLNNSADGIKLTDINGNSIDSVLYFSSWGGGNGYSLERITTLEDSNNLLNWKTSRNNSGSTPGEINSVSQKDFDIAVSGIIFNPESPISGDEVTISALIKNPGKNRADFSLLLFEDTNPDSLPEKLIDSLSYSNLLPGDSVIAAFNYSINKINETHNFAAEAYMNTDQDTDNNFAYRSISPGYRKNTIVINEIMYDPLKGEPEWIEIFNNTDKQINLKNWSIINLLPSPSISNLAENDFLIDSAGYAIIAPDSSFLLFHNNFQGQLIISDLGSLNNTADGIKLIDNNDNLIDSVIYYSSWGGGTGNSIERISAAQSSNDQMNWAPSKDNSGSTPGKINSVSRKDLDIEASEIIFDPASPLSGDKVKISVLIKNPGRSEADFSIYLLEDINNNPFSANSLDSVSYSNLPPDDSVIITFKYSIKGITKGLTFIAKVKMDSDQDTTNNTLYKSISPGYRNNSIVINEIMYDPAEGEPEWIELFNNSNEQINLRDWHLINLLPTQSSSRLAEFNYLFDPAEYLIISRDSSFTNIHPGFRNKILIFDFGSLNNSADGINLTDGNGNTIDSVTYLASWGGGTGNSIERISAAQNSNDQMNWASSKDISGSTPGKINSVSRKDYDIEVSKILFDPIAPISGDDVKISAMIKNPGKNNAGFSILLFETTNQDSIPGILLDSLSYNNLPPEDSIIIKFNYFIKKINRGHNFIVESKMESDQVSSNNSYYDSITPGYRSNSLAINEIMYEPAANEPEWIELFNNSNQKINLKNWRVINLIPSVRQYPITVSDYFINPGSYLIIAADTSFLSKHANFNSDVIFLNFGSLNNNFDGIAIRDLNNNLIDSLVYSSDWGGGNGVSLERISTSINPNNRENWTASGNNTGSTPGGVNSVSQKDFDIALTKIMLEPASPLIGDEVKISSVVKNPGKNTTDFSLLLFDFTNSSAFSGMPVDSIYYKNLPPADSAIITFNYSVREISGTHNFIAEAKMDSDQDTTNNTLIKSISPGYRQNSFVINEIMYDPANGESEWIEIFNNSKSQINLKNWSIINLLPAPSKSRISGMDYLIDPGAYSIIARDSSYYNIHPKLKSQVIISDFGSLNNSEDGISLTDGNDNYIDSINYFSSWGGGKGISLERISPDIDSNSPFNWKISKDNSGSTPGRINSVSRKDFDIEVARIIFNPAAPLSGDNVKISALIKNPGKNKADFIINLFEDADSGATSDNFLDSISYNNLAPGDSVIIIFNYSIKKIDKEHNFFATAVMNSDQDTTNNNYYAGISPGYRQNNLVITEIMFDPSINEPEWIELHNNLNNEIILKDWSIKNTLPSPHNYTIDSENYVIGPGEYVIITLDSSFFNSHPDVKDKVLISRFGSLSNSSDGLVLFDNKGSVIDSILYSSTWGGRNGFSLEKINYSAESTDSTNWRTSVNPGKSTPGFENSAAGLKSYYSHALIINEIMFDPAPDNSEFIEFYNTTDSTLDVGGWKFLNESGNEFFISKFTRRVNPGEFIVLVADSSFIKHYTTDTACVNIVNVSSFSLSNSSGLILLKDSFDNTIDSVRYFENWHNPNFTITRNKSLEKINPYLNGTDKNDWSTSANALGATPGMQNSIFTVNPGRAGEKISISPNPFSPDNDGYEDFTIIHYHLSQKTAQVKIEIFDSRGRLVRTLENNTASGSDGSIIFDGLDDNYNPLRMGIYILLIEALNRDSGVTEKIKKVVVVAKKF